MKKYKKHFSIKGHEREDTNLYFSFFIVHFSFNLSFAANP